MCSNMCVCRRKKGTCFHPLAVSPGSRMPQSDCVLCSDSPCLSRTAPRHTQHGTHAKPPQRQPWLQRGHGARASQAPLAGIIRVGPTKGCLPDDPNGLDWRVFMRRGVLADWPHQGGRLGVAVGYLDVESHHALPHLERHRSCACTATALAAPVDPAAAAIAAARAPTTGSTAASPSNACPAPDRRIPPRGCPRNAAYYPPGPLNLLLGLTVDRQFVAMMKKRFWYLNLWVLHRSPRFCSSVGQSEGLLILRSSVRARSEAVFFF